MKRTCCNCGVQFTPTRDKGYRCTKCRSEYNRAHYLQNQTEYVARANRRKKRVLQENTQAILEYLAKHPCVDCGEKDVVVLEFDHLRDKTRSVARMISFGSALDTIFAEIAKCEVRCANCHRRVTAKRAGWRKYRFGDL